MTTNTSFAASLLLACAGCAPGELDAGSIGESAQAIVAGGATVEGTTFDGIPAYGCGNTACGSFNVYTDNGINTSETDPGGWFRTEGGSGYQCVELAVRYEWAKFKVSGWSIGTAQQMCGTHPSSMVTTTNPVPGDLMVFGPNACPPNSGIGSAGHVAVVDSVAGGTIHTTQENIAANYAWARSCASCFLHATANVTNPSDPCSHENVGDGMYCGSTLTGGDPNKLYHCVGDATAGTTACACGCTVEPAGTADKCAACDLAPPPEAADLSTAPDLAEAPAPTIDLAPAPVPVPVPAPGGPGSGTMPGAPIAGGCAIALARHAGGAGAGLEVIGLLLVVSWAIRRRAAGAR
jgi:CHAP domain